MSKHCTHSGEASCTQPISEQVSHILHQAEVLCVAKNLRFTQSRRRILELVCQSEQPVGAYRLLDDLREDGVSAAPPTVYRALDFLLDNGLIHRLATNNTYLACAHPEKHHEGVFLVCSECGHTQELHTKGVIDIVKRNAKAYDFTVKHAAVEVTGLCKQCGEK